MNNLDNLKLPYEELAISISNKIINLEFERTDENFNILYNEVEKLPKFEKVTLLEKEFDVQKMVDEQELEDLKNYSKEQLEHLIDIYIMDTQTSYCFIEVVVKNLRNIVNAHRKLKSIG